MTHERRILTSEESLRLAQRFFDVMTGVMGEGDGRGYISAEEHDIFIHASRCDGYCAMSTECNDGCDCQPVHLRVAGREVIEVRSV